MRLYISPKHLQQTQTSLKETNTAQKQRCHQNQKGLSFDLLSMKYYCNITQRYSRRMFNMVKEAEWKETGVCCSTVSGETTLTPLEKAENPEFHFNLRVLGKRCYSTDYLPRHPLCVLLPVCDPVTSITSSVAPCQHGLTTQRWSNAAKVSLHLHSSTLIPAGGRYAT